MREDYLRLQDRRRRNVAVAAALAFYVVAAGVIFLRSVFGYETVGMGSGSIEVRIGTPEGLDETSRLLPAPGPIRAVPTVPQAAAAPVRQPPAAPPPAPPAPKEAASTEAIPAPAAAQAPAQAPKPQPASAAAKAAAGAESTAQPQAASVAGALGTGAGQAASVASGAGGGPTGTGATTLKGSEQGNSFETNFEAGSGRITRSLYVPIYLYMPLPHFLDKGLYDAVPASKDGLQTAEIRKALLRQYYSQTGTLFRLTEAGVPMAQRPAIWVILADAGYRIDQADYKYSRSINPVVVEFMVSAPDANDRTSLLSVKIVSSSGYSDIDEAVLYGFGMGAFSNDQNRTITGRFTYNFR
jgi:outer membrane biosynthesis protein TonB